MPHEPFRFKTFEQLLDKAGKLGCDLPHQEYLAPLRRRVRIGRFEAPNALGVQPMEGCDGTADGKPDELTRRRYRRFGRGGAGLLWFEATAIVPEGRANPRQLLLAPENAEALAALRREAVQAAKDANGDDHEPFCVLQLTHSGRYSRPVAAPAPIIAHHDGLLDKAAHLPDDYPLISDDALDRLQDRYVAAARLAQACGFHGVDIKSCHRYLLSELLAAHTRPGRYGGSFENRTRMLLSVARRVHQEVPEIELTTRLNIYDGHPYPWGWGVSQADAGIPDLREPIELVRLLKEAGVAMIDVTIGNPYFTPHINRPFDRNVDGGYVPDEHPLIGVTRIIELAAQIKATQPEMVIVGSGYSWLRQYLGQVAAGVLARGGADIVALGRQAFAYPDFARDLLTKGEMDSKQVCLACSRCTQIMRDHGRTGCVLRDREVYGPIYREGRADG